MTFLVLNDDGMNAEGLKVLRENIRRQWRNGKVVVLTTPSYKTGCSFSISPELDLENMKAEDLDQIEADVYAIDATPADLVDVAFMRSDLFIPSNAVWEMVFVGVNHGHNVGADVLTSGTVAAAIHAAYKYAVPAWAISQELPKGTDLKNPDRVLFTPADNLLVQVFRNHAPGNGEVANVNFPATAYRGLAANCQIAHYSDWRMPPVSVVPRANNEKTDLTHLKQGMATVSTIQLRVNRQLRY